MVPIFHDYAILTICPYYLIKVSSIRFYAIGRIIDNTELRLIHEAQNSFLLMRCIFPYVFPHGETEKNIMCEGLCFYSDLNETCNSK